MSKTDVDLIKANIDIVSVISEHVQLNKRGRTLWGLCPFHNEKTPSFQVDPDRQSYKCFGCDKGGDVISFLMEKKALSFLEALQELSHRTGIPIESGNRTPSSRRKTYYEMNRVAMQYYERMLSQPSGKNALTYLSSRGLSDAAIRDFHLGWVPDSWDGLCSHLDKNGLSLQAAHDCGLVVKRASGGFYDRFRNRIMFPIHDLSGEVIGFGGRIIGSGEPKYLNSPESPLFTKRKVLYNLNRAREHLRSGPVVIVEGYMDVISLGNAGFHRAVATLGTALTQEHIHLLRRFTDTMVLVFDGDSAGKRAMLRALEPFLASDVVPQVVLLPAGKDPDDIARTDIRQWDKLLGSAKSLWDLVIDESFSARDPSKLSDQNKILRELTPVIARISDEVIRNLLVQRLAGRLGVGAEMIFSLISPVSRTPQDLPAGEQPLTGIEETFVRLLLCDPEAVHLVRRLGLENDFQDTGMRDLFAYIIEH
ncbi:MAG: DNA primase, partial [Desulfomonilia bacterium]|nr:DNA primase [Desulfomonilia bacterium]